MNFSLRHNKGIKKLTMITGVSTIIITLISYLFLPKEVRTQIGFDGNFNRNNKLLYATIMVILSAIFIILTRKDKYKDSIVHCLIGSIIILILNIIIVVVNLNL